MATFTKSLIYCILICTLSSLCMADISSIDSITNERLITNFDQYSCAVSSYENRLIVSGHNSVEEYEILPSGDLERISFYEKRNSFYYGFVDEDRFYDIDTDTYEDRVNITIYDLTQMPMEVLTNLEVIMDAPSQTKAFFTDNHLILTDTWVDLANNRGILINKETLEIDGYINSYFHLGQKAFSGSTLIETDFSSELGYFLSFSSFQYDPVMNTYQIEHLSDFVIGLYEGGMGNMEIIDNCVVLSCAWVYIIDIQDISNPTILHHISTDIRPCHTLFNEDYIFISGGWAQLYVYSRVDESLIFSEVGLGIANFRTLHLKYPYLYMNKGNGMMVYNVENGITPLRIYGQWDAHSSYNENEAFYLYTDPNERYFNNVFLHRFYSTFSGELICSFESENLDVYQYKIIDNILYVSGQDWSNNWSRYFHIYEIQNQELTLITSLDFANNWFFSFQKIENRFYFQLSSPTSVSVYDLVDNELSFVGSFLGQIPDNISNIPQNYILNYQNRRIIIRDIDDYTNILLNLPISQPSASRSYALYHHDDGIFILVDNDLFSPQYLIYSFDITNNSVTLIEQGNTLLNTFNKIITKHNSSSSQVDFYTISDNTLNHIGELENPNRLRLWNFFYPEMNKMVMHNSGSSLKLYDIEYSVSDTDTVIKPSKTELLGNYPNPFNPETTISFSLETDSFINLDIYNIKGQKVRSLVSDFKTAGVHAIIWNGKDERGRDVGNGVYFCRLKTERYVSTRKMMLLK